MLVYLSMRLYVLQGYDKSRELWIYKKFFGSQ